jgi:general secretion pathway protein A
MYQEFYGLRDIPFSLAPDPKYLFRTESLNEVFANLQYGIENGKGIIVVTGEVGTGKTTILRSMLQSLDRSILAAYIFNPLLSTQEFFELLADECRVKPQPSKAAMLRVLGQVLIRRHMQGLRTVLVVDEAHLLPKHLLEEIRLLSNFETNREKLLQIVLCGQPELQDVLAAQDARQLKQRISLRCSIKPLTDRETAEYIRWRLRIAGAKDENIFDEEAMAVVHQFSGGIPRIINNICDNALLTGFSIADRKITASIVQEVVEILDLAGTEPNSLGLSSMHSVSECSTSHTEDSCNVRYIRRDRPASGPKSSNVRFVIKPENCDDQGAPLKFFSRVRVTRDS